MAIKTVGFIGIGMAGYHLAKNLANRGKYNLVVRDLNPSPVAAFLEEVPSAREAEAGPNAFAEVDMLITMLPNGHIVRDVLLGKDGVAPVLKKGTVVVDMSSSDPRNTATLANELKEKYGLFLVDSPLTQERSHCIRDGEVTYMVGGEDEPVAVAIPVLRHMSKHVFRMGGPGTGHAAKTLNNYTLAAGMAALVDSLVMGAKIGLDPLTLCHAFNVGTARNFSSAFSMREDGLSRNHKSGAQLNLYPKDLGIARDLFASHGMDTNLTELLRSRFAEAQEHASGPAACHTELLDYWESKNGVTIPVYKDVGGSAGR